MERTGGCLCGSARYVAELARTELDACHCTMCQRWSGGVMIAVRATLRWEEDDTVAVYRSSAWAERGFCRQCGSSLFYRVTAEGRHRGNTFVTVGTLDDRSGLRLTSEMFTDHRPEAYAFAGELEGMTEAEVMAAFGAELG